MGTRDVAVGSSTSGSVTAGAGPEVRTPLRQGAHYVWACPARGSVRFGRRGRYRTLIAGMHPRSYLLAQEDHLLVATPEKGTAHGFILDAGAALPVGPIPLPAWSRVVEAVLPDPTMGPSWLEIVVHDDVGRWRCGIPRGTLPRVQALLIHRGLRITYVAQRDLGT